MLIFGSLWAQKGTDIVKLRNGSVYRGTIIEMIPSQHLLFLTLDGRQMTFHSDVVKSAEVNVSAYAKVRVPRPLIEIKNGYFNSSDVGLTFCLEDYGGISARPTANIVNGYQFGRYSVGAGIGFATFRHQHYLPLFLDVRTYLREKDAFSPYIAVQAGYAAGLTRNYDYSPYYLENFAYYQEPKKTNGFIGGVQLGIRKYTGRHFGYNLSFGTRMLKTRGEYIRWYWNGNENVPVEVTEVTRMIRSEVRVGIYFN